MLRQPLAELYLVGPEVELEQHPSHLLLSQVVPVVYVDDCDVLDDGVPAIDEPALPQRPHHGEVFVQVPPPWAHGSAKGASVKGFSGLTGAVEPARRLLGGGHASVLPTTPGPEPNG